MGAPCLSNELNELCVKTRCENSLFTILCHCSLDMLHHIFWIIFLGSHSLTMLTHILDHILDSILVDYQNMSQNMDQY